MKVLKLAFAGLFLLAVGSTVLAQSGTESRWQNSVMSILQLKLGGAMVTSTAMELNRAADVSARVVTQSTAALSVTEALHDSKTILMTHTAAASTHTLPAATGSGAMFRFVVGAVNTNDHVIQVANATDVMDGNIVTNSTGDTPDLSQPWATGATSDTITLNGTTTGGVSIGDYVELQDVASGQWVVRGYTTSSGAEATPFSAGVS